MRFDARETAYLGKTGEAPLEEADMLFAVSDGMGGAAGGEVASKIAVREIAALMPRSFHVRGQGFTEAPLAYLDELFSKIHEKVAYQGRFYDETKHMGATLSLVWLTPETVWFGHVGDSRVYHLAAAEASGIQQVTMDHSRVGRLRREGRISESEARRHPEKNQIDQVLGGRGKEVEPQLGRIDWGAGDRLILCTDGIVDALSDNALEKLVRRPVPRLADIPEADRLIKEALETSGRDNLTCLVLENVRTSSA
jgi:protein phosphatase